MTIQAADEPRFRVPSTRPEQLLASMSPAEAWGHLQALHGVTEAVLAHLVLPELLRELLSRLRETLSVDTATILLCTPGGKTLAVRASKGLEEEVEQQVEIPIGQGIAGAVAARRQAVIVDDVSTFETASPMVRRLASMMVAPLIATGDLLGVLHVGTLAPRQFSARDLYLLQVVADRAALAIKNALLYDESQEELRARARAEAAHREVQARFRVYAESASDAIFAMDEASVIQYANPAVERVFGYRPEELIGQSLQLLVPERMREAHREGVEHFLATGERRIPWDGVELPGLHRDGHEVALEISFGTYEHEGRRFFTGIARDVTERVEQRHQLEELATELESTVEELKIRSVEAEAADQAKTDFLAVMSHELRTPLTAVIGYADLLEMGIPAPVPEAALDSVLRIGAAARHQLTLIEEILSFARLQAGQEIARREPVDLAEVTREAVEFVVPIARIKEIDLVVDAAEPLPLVSDAGKIRQVLSNLLSNAVKFTRHGSIRVRLARTAEEAVVEVEDTGVGIAAEHLERIFEPFWQVQQTSNREAEGAGLGLALAHRIAAELLQGRVTVSSTPGAGSTFRFHLPLVPAD